MVMKRFFIVLLVLAFAAGIGWQFRDKFRHADAALMLYGNVDIRGVDLGFRVAGRLLEVCKDEGDAVHAGDLLARIDDEPYAHELARAEADRIRLNWRVSSEKKIQQAGIRLMWPLGVAVLPAFVLIAVLPLAVSMLRGN